VLSSQFSAIPEVLPLAVRFAGVAGAVVSGVRMALIVVATDSLPLVSTAVM